jgi:hypothetical protein
MLNNFIITTALLISATTALAAPRAITDILPNGSLTRCREASDAGSRAFQLTMTDVTPTALTLKVDTLVCLRLEDSMTLVPYALAEKQIFKNNGHIISYENIEASLAITNTEATVVLGRLYLDLTKFSQNVIINSDALSARVFDISLQMLEVIRIDGKPVDQTVRTNGSYRITLKD